MTSNNNSLHWNANGIKKKKNHITPSICNKNKNSINFKIEPRNQIKHQNVHIYHNDNNKRWLIHNGYIRSPLFIDHQIYLNSQKMYIKISIANINLQFFSFYKFLSQQLNTNGLKKIISMVYNNG